MEAEETACGDIIARAACYGRSRVTRTRSAEAEETMPAIQSRYPNGWCHPIEPVRCTVAFSSRWRSSLRSLRPLAPLRLGSVKCEALKPPLPNTRPELLHA